MIGCDDGDDDVDEVLPLRNSLGFSLGNPELPAHASPLPAPVCLWAPALPSWRAQRGAQATGLGLGI